MPRTYCTPPPFFSLNNTTLFLSLFEDPRKHVLKKTEKKTRQNEKDAIRVVSINSSTYLFELLSFILLVLERKDGPGTRCSSPLDFWISSLSYNCLCTYLFFLSLSTFVCSIPFANVSLVSVEFFLSPVLVCASHVPLCITDFPLPIRITCIYTPRCNSPVSSSSPSLRGNPVR